MKLPDRRIFSGQRRDPLPGGIIPSYSPKGFVADTSGAFSDAAKIWSGVADAFQKDQENLENFETARKFYETEGAVDQQYQHNVENADPTGRDFAKNDTETTKPHWDSFLAGVPARLRPKYDAIVTRERMSRERRALGYEFKQRETHYTGQIGIRAEQLLPQVAGDPDQYDAAVADIDNYIDSSGLSPASKGHLRDSIHDKLGASRLQGLINAGRLEEAEQFKNELNERDRQRQEAAPKLQRRSGLTQENASAVASTAQRLGIKPDDLAAAISYETGGTFNPSKYGGKGGVYLGLIQFSPENQRKYGVVPGMSFAEQMPAVEAYLRDRGVKPGHGIAEIYSIINAGSLDRNGEPRWNASDGNGTVRSHVAKIEAEHYGKTRYAQADTGTATDASAQARTADPSGAPDEVIAGDTAAPVGRWDAVVQKLTAERDNAIKQQNIELAKQSAEQEKAEAARVELQLVDAAAGHGPMPPRDAVRNNPLLGMQKTVELTKKWDEANKENNALQKDMQRYTFGGPFNPYDANDKKSLDRIYTHLGRSPSTLDDIITRTGGVPPMAVEHLRGAMVSGDPKKVGDASSVALGLMNRNPHAFTGQKGGNEIEDTALTYRRYVDRLGMTPDEAAAKITEDNKPENKAKVQARLKNEDVDALVKKELKISDLASRFDENLLRHFLPRLIRIPGDPTIEFTPEKRRAAFDDFSFLFRQKYLQHGDKELAKDQAAADMKKMWGRTLVNGSEVVVRLPPERAPAYNNISDVAGKFAAQAIAEIKAGTGQTVARESLVISPAPTGQTAQDYFAGKPPRYILQWRDSSGNLQTLQQGRAFVADPDVMRAPERKAQDRRRAVEEVQRAVRAPTPAQQRETRERRAEQEDIAAERMSTLRGLREERERQLREMEANRAASSPAEPAPVGGAVTLPSLPGEMP